MAALKRSGSGRRPYVIFSGSKMFWQTKDYIDIWIVDHKSNSAIEIVAYDSSQKFESPRIYLDTAVLKRKIDRGAIDRKLQAARRNSFAVDGAVDSAVMDNAIIEAVTGYVLPRIVHDEYAPSGKFSARWQFQMGDFNSNVNAPLIISKPAELIPYRIRHNKESIVSVVKQMQFNLRGAIWGSSKLTIRERWRIPIVLLKVKRWRRLLENDSRIFQKIRGNMKTEADVQRLEAVLNNADASCGGGAAASAGNGNGNGGEAGAWVSLKSPRSTAAGASHTRRSISKSTSEPFNWRRPSLGFGRSNSKYQAKSLPPSTKGNAETGTTEEVGENVDSNTAGAVDYVVTAFTAFGSSIKSSFSTKKKAAAVVPMTEQPRTSSMAIGDRALQATAAVDSFNGLASAGASVGDTENLTKGKVGITSIPSGLTAQSSQVTFSSTSSQAARRKPKHSVLIEGQEQDAAAAPTAVECGCGGCSVRVTWFRRPSWGPRQAAQALLRWREARSRVHEEGAQGPVA